MKTEPLVFRTLTPIWTGGVDRNSSHAKETGLIGSLRWWYEGLIRGFGGEACDPAAHKCKDKCHCAACELFGCTGWSRQFRLEVEGLEPLPLFFMSYRSTYTGSGNWLTRLFPGGRAKRDEVGRLKFFFDRAKTLWAEETFSIRIIPLARPRDVPENIYAQLVFLLAFIAQFGGLGAKTQNGFGQLLPLEPFSTDLIRRGRTIIREQAVREKLRSDDLFRIDRFFSTVYEIADGSPEIGMEVIGEPPQGFNFKLHFIPCAFDIRYKSSTCNPRTGRGQNIGMRPFFRERFGRDLASALLGETRPKSDGDRTGSRIHVSHLYRQSPKEPFRLKIWGYVPSHLDLTVEDVSQAVAEFITVQMFPNSRLAERFDLREVMI